MRPLITACLMLFAARSAALAQITFTKITASAVVTNAANSLGAAWVDFDNDGDLDLYVNNGNGANLFYRNDGKGLFIRITTGPTVNYGFSASWADMDNDGRIDLFSTTQGNGGGQLLRQLATGVFTESHVEVGFCFGAAWGDYDNDGFVDLLTGDQTQNVLWHNNGEGELVAVTDTQIITAATAGGITWVDYDRDGDVDLLVAGVTSQLYRNDGVGIFTPITNEQLMERGTLASGAAWGDYDNDGYPDLFLPRSDPAGPAASFLFHNSGDGAFTQVEQSPFIDDLGFSLNASWGDYDNDGWLDLIATETNNGKNRLYHNNGDGTFTRVFTGPIADDEGNCTPGIWGDYDRDGFLDLFVSTHNPDFGNPSQPNDYLYHNDGNSNAWITIKCVGTRSNRSALGAKVRAKATIGSKSVWQLREINTGDGWGGIQLEAHFGLGNATNVETLRIEWPSGTVQEFQNVASKQYLTVTEPSRLVAAESNGAPQLTLEGGRNMEYQIQLSTNLTAWSELTTITITNLNGTALVTDTSLSASDGRFYRAVLH